MCNRQKYDKLVGQLLYSKNPDDVFVGLALLDSEVKIYKEYPPETAPEYTEYACVAFRFTGKRGWTSKLCLMPKLFEYPENVIIQILRHEMNHKFLMHLFRKPTPREGIPKDFQDMVWAQVTDAVINSRAGIYNALKNLGHPLADCIPVTHKLNFIEGKVNLTSGTEEQFWAAILDTFPKLEMGSGGSEPGDGSGSQNKPLTEQGIEDLLKGKTLGKTIVVDEEKVTPPEKVSPEKLDSLKQTIISDVERVGKAAGSIPNHISEIIKAAKKTKLICWKRLIKQGVASAVKRMRTQSATKLNRKLQFGFGKSKNRGGRALFMLDTSGSMSSSILSVALGEVLKLLKNAEVDLAVYSHGLATEVQPIRGRKLEFNIKGRGGTSVDSAFKDLEKQGNNLGYDMVFIISDFYDTTRTETSIFGRANVHWVKTDKGSMSPKFGKVIDIHEQLRSL